MQKIRTFILISLFPLLLQAQPQQNAAYLNYIEQYKDLAIEQMLRYNIPASITMAQGLFESAAGRSELARKGNNHFGIKCHGWQGRATYHDDDAAQECFRAYDNVRESFEDHSKFLSRGPRYASLFSLKRTDYRGWAYGLKQCGYATNPKYAEGLIRIIELYRLNELDQADKYDKFLAKHSSTDQPADQNGQLHTIRAYNKNYYLMARTGDTFKSIGKEVGLTARKLARYNERDHREKLSQGDIIYLKKKRTKADKKYRKVLHTVKANESMYSISQRYGIRLKSLYKKNHLTTDYQIRVGDKLRVY